MGSVINVQDSKNWFVTPSGITVSGWTKSYKTYDEMLADANPGKYASVSDATGDPTVSKGSAIYRRDGNKWTKIFEEEVMDLETSELFTWNKLTGKPTASPEGIDLAVGQSHIHVNEEVLEGLSVNTDGALVFNGAIVGSVANVEAVARELRAVSSTVTQHSATIETQSRSISDLQTKSTEVDRSISAINDTLSNLADNEAFERLNAGLTSLNSSLSTANAQITEHTRTLGDHGNQINALYTWKDSATSQINTRLTIDAFNQYKTQAETLAAQLTSKVDSLSNMGGGYIISTPQIGSGSVSAIAGSWVVAPAGGVTVVMPTNNPAEGTMIKLSVTEDAVATFDDADLFTSGTVVDVDNLYQNGRLIDGPLQIDSAQTITFMYLTNLRTVEGRIVSGWKIVECTTL